MFGRRPIERDLERLYAQILTSTLSTPADAKVTARRMLAQAIAESKRDGTYALSREVGSVALGGAKTQDPRTERWAQAVRNRLPLKREDGVTDDDIRWWWNLDDVERRMIEKVDEQSRIAMFLQGVQDSTEASQDARSDDAAAKVRRYHAMYGDPADASYSAKTGTGPDDRLLPCELIDRVNRYIQRRVAEDPQAYKEDMERASTFNALVRKEIKAGRL